MAPFRDADTSLLNMLAQHILIAETLFGVATDVATNLAQARDRELAQARREAWCSMWEQIAQARAIAEKLGHDVADVDAARARAGDPYLFVVQHSQITGAMRDAATAAIGVLRAIDGRIGPPIGRSEWALLRVWHFEAMECVIYDRPAHFVRTSYVTAPPRWRSLSNQELAARIEQLLAAHYRIRTATLHVPGIVDERMLPFAYYFEWVGHAETPADSSVRADPWLYPCARANPRLEELATIDLDAILQAARPGIDARCYADAFEVFRIDEDDTWHIVDWDERAALFAARHGTASRASRRPSMSTV